MPFPTRYSFSKAKQPIDEDIKKRNKTAGDPPKEAGFPSQSGGPGSAPNPNNSTTPSRDHKPRNDIDSNEEGQKVKLSEMQWQLGSYSLELETDMEGHAKWPLSFKRIEKDVKRPNKPCNPTQQPKVGQDKKNDQPPTAV